MAKFYMEDGSIKSYDELIEEYNKNKKIENDNSLIKYKLGEILKRMSENMNKAEIDKQCVLDLFTGTRHACILKTEIKEDGKEHRVRDCEYCINHWLLNQYNK